MSRIRAFAAVFGLILLGESCIVSPMAFAAGKPPQLRTSKIPALGKSRVPVMRTAVIPSLSAFMNPVVKKPVVKKTTRRTR